MTATAQDYRLKAAFYRSRKQEFEQQQAQLREEGQRARAERLDPVIAGVGRQAENHDRIASEKEQQA